jgi:hypothetical protein
MNTRYEWHHVIAKIAEDAENDLRLATKLCALDARDEWIEDGTLVVVVASDRLDESGQAIEAATEVTMRIFGLRLCVMSFG